MNAQNLRVRWSHTVGLGFRLKTPLGGALAVDYGFLLNPSEFLIPQNLNTTETHDRDLSSASGTDSVSIYADVLETGGQ